MPNLPAFGFLGLALALGALVALPLGGCSSSTSGNTGGSGGSGTTSSHAGGSHAHTGGSGGSIDCADLAKNAVATPIPVRLVNDTAANLYIRYSESAECAQLPFKIKDPGGDELSWNNGSNCVTTCADANCTCTTTCSYPPVTLIAPKGSVTVMWKGVVREKVTLPASCIEPACAAGEPCDVEVMPKSFPLSFVGTLWTDVKCFGPCTPCVPDASGSCQYDVSGLSADVSGTFVEATTTYAAGDSKVDIVFTAP